MAAPERRGPEEPADGAPCSSCVALAAENQTLKARLAEVEKAVEDLRRSSKRQAAPFSKGGVR